MKVYNSIVFILLAFRAFSQSGCTDPSANNYNASATSNNGSCIYNATTMACHQKGVLTPSVTESSGLLYLNGSVWTHNDSGNSADIFKVDTANGAILQKVSVVNHINTDWEDIAADSTYIYLGDFGNNDGVRTDLKVLRIRRDSVGSGATATVNATAINFSYADQVSFSSNSSTNFDCEAMISMGSSLYLFSKNRGDFQTRVYKLSKIPGTYTLAPYASYNVGGEITGADYNAQLHEVVLIGYLSTKKNSFLWFLNDFAGDQFFSGNKRRVEIGNSVAKWQTEGVTYAGGNELFVSCETSDYPATLYNTFKPFATPVGIKEYAGYRDDLNVYPNPANDFVTVESSVLIYEIEVISPDGRLCYNQKINGNKATIALKEAGTNGLCLIKIKTASGIYFRKVALQH